MDKGGPDDFLLRDVAIRRPAEDAFGRDAFASRLTEALVSWDLNENSLVIGLDGEWGEGKTSLFVLLEWKLQQEGFLVAWFNPWLFGRDETEMAAEFFRVLHKLIEGQAKWTAEKREDVRKRLRDYGPPLISAATSLLPAALQKVAEGALKGALSGFIADVPIAEQRLKLGELMSEAPQRMVILVDDVDRLTDVEALRVCTLVRLVADFPNVAYVMAYDSKNLLDLLAIGLNDRSPERRVANGFRERLVQTELRLPVATEAELSKFYTRALKAALTQAKINPADPIVDASLTRAQELWSFWPRRVLSTPRAIRRFAASLAFFLTATRGSVDVGDAILLEIVRLQAPTTYEMLRSNPLRFTGGGELIDQFRWVAGDKKREELLADLLSGVHADYMSDIRRILLALMPQLEGREGDSPQLRRANRFSAASIVARYFRLGLTPDDVDEEELATIVVEASTGTTDRLTELIQGRRQDSALLRLADLVAGGNDDAKRRVRVAVANVARSAKPEFAAVGRSWWEHLAFIYGDAMFNLSFDKDSIAEAEALPAPFLADAVRWAEYKFDQSRSDTADTAGEPTGLTELRGKAAEKLMTEIASDAAWDQTTIGKLIAVLRHWRKDATPELLKTVLADRPDRASKLLAVRVGSGASAARALVISPDIFEEVDLEVLLSLVKRDAKRNEAHLTALQAAVDEIRSTGSYRIVWT